MSKPTEPTRFPAMSTQPPGTVWKLIRQVERASAKLESCVEDLAEIRHRVERLERHIWIGLGIVLTLQVVFGVAQ